MKISLISAALFLSLCAIAQAGPIVDAITPAPPDLTPPAGTTDDGSLPKIDPDQMDPYKIPAAFRHSSKSQLSPADRAAVQDSEKKNRENKNWLVRGYERQMQARAKDGGSDSSANLYTELTGDKDLARASGLSEENFSNLPDIVDLHASNNHPASLRSDPTLDAISSNAPSASPLFRPLITPLSSRATMGVAAPFAAPSPIFQVTSTPISFGSGPVADETASNDTAQLVRSQNPGVLDIPGLTAARSNPSTTDDDALPDDVSLQGKPHHDLSLELPAATNTDRLQKLQNNLATALPGQQPKKPTSAVIAQPLVDPPSDTQEMVPDPSPMRSHIGDPFDILR